MPVLGIRKAGNALTVFWKTAKLTYGLETNNILGANGWSPIATQTVSNETQVTVSPGAAATFFRLKR